MNLFLGIHGTSINRSVRLFWASKDVKKSEKGADNGERSDEWERVWKNAIGPAQQQIEIKGGVEGGRRPHFDAQVS